MSLAWERDHREQRKKGTTCRHYNYQPRGCSAALGRVTDWEGEEEEQARRRDKWKIGAGVRRAGGSNRWNRDSDGEMMRDWLKKKKAERTGRHKGWDRKRVKSERQWARERERKKSENQQHTNRAICRGEEGREEMRMIKTTHWKLKHWWAMWRRAKEVERWKEEKKSSSLSSSEQRGATVLGVPPSSCGDLSEKHTHTHKHVLARTN